MDLTTRREVGENMHIIRCAHCRGVHGTVASVLECSRLSAAEREAREVAVDRGQDLADEARS